MFPVGHSEIPAEEIDLKRRQRGEGVRTAHAYAQKILSSLCNSRNSEGGFIGTPSFSPSSASRFSRKRIWLSNTAPKLRASECATSCSAICFPSSLSIEVTGFDSIPQGTIRSK